MRILVTNDDGIDAAGLAILTEAARQLTDDVWIVAPATEQSGQSHAVTLTDPLRIARLDEKRFAVSGTPADCVTMALEVAMDAPPDLVLSGVNQGFNVADDMLYSGTVGAAMQASASGIRAIAFSQAYKRLGQEHDEDIWMAAQGHCGSTLQTLAALDHDPKTVLNVNFPACPAEEVEGLEVVFEEDAIEAIAELAATANEQLENIGARRLVTIVERVFEEASFDAPERVTSGKTELRITGPFVREQVAPVVADADLSNFVL